MTRGGPNIAGTNGPGGPLIAGDHKFRDIPFQSFSPIVRRVVGLVFARTESWLIASFSTFF